MPVYEYRCKACGRTSEIEHGFHAERPTQCPTCGGPLARVFHPVGVVFKGSGFHKTDYSASGVRKDPVASTDGAAAKSSDGAAGDGKASPEKKSPSESKPQSSGAAKSDSSAKP